jgi:hypothetical protein
MLSLSIGHIISWFLKWFVTIFNLARLMEGWWNMSKFWGTYCCFYSFPTIFFPLKRAFDWAITNMFETWGTPHWHRNLNVLPSPKIKTCFLMLPSALCPLTRPWALDNLHIYRWKLSNGRTISDEKCNARCLKSEIVSLGNILGNDGNTLREKNNWKIPHSPIPNPKDTKTCPQTTCWVFPLARMKVFFSKLLITFYSLY